MWKITLKEAQKTAEAMLKFAFKDKTGKL